ncbi:MAG: hypothetical protein GY782_10050 [Gammaproteobacteria bacterium]|nr:hypothetical protein [Gammaproteobacteria bacterium]
MKISLIIEKQQPGRRKFCRLAKEAVNYNRLKAVASIYAWKADYHAKASII